jgi:hypothetical protein
MKIVRAVMVFVLMFWKTTVTLVHLISDIVKLDDPLTKLPR